MCHVAVNGHFSSDLLPVAEMNRFLPKPGPRLPEKLRLASRRRYPIKELGPTKIELVTSDWLHYPDEGEMRNLDVDTPGSYEYGALLTFANGQQRARLPRTPKMRPISSGSLHRTVRMLAVQRTTKTHATTPP